ncbi:hypothetical protein BDZ91DRAFT_461560 [Kalaharituber pfeilii]|nr:hypothetical protein BDZ91DRAFT_461560 [Kalaharituber pfeilii]
MMMDLSAIRHKDFHVILQRLLSRTDVRLGRIVSNWVDPAQSFIDPSFSDDELRPYTSKTLIQNFCHVSGSSRTLTLGGILTQLFSASRSAKKETNVVIKAEQMEKQKFINLETFFDKAIMQDQVQQWLGNICKQGCRAYMITGYMVFRNLHFTVGIDRQVASAGTMEGAAAVGHAIAAAACSISPIRVTKSRQNSNFIKCHADAPGDTVWAVVYQKIKLHASLPTMPLSLSPKSKQWTVMTSTRGHSDQMLIEAELDEPWDGHSRHTLEHELANDGVKGLRYLVPVGDAEDVFFFPSADESDEDEEEESEKDEEEEMMRSKRRKVLRRENSHEEEEESNEAEEEEMMRSKRRAMRIENDSDAEEKEEMMRKRRKVMEIENDSPEQQS